MGPEFIRSVYRANFAEDLDISIASVLERRLDSLGQSGAAMIQQAQSPESKKNFVPRRSVPWRSGSLGRRRWWSALNCSGEMIG
ncbi:MAG: hypothetical protein Q7J84_17325 [Sulfuricaulis sp.]|nr:hypothetical protein [Sulfuricaulis sp.]